MFFTNFINWIDSSSSFKRSNCNSMFAPVQKILKIVENTYFLVKLTLKGGSGLLQSILLSNTSLLALRLPQNQVKYLNLIRHSSRSISIQNFVCWKVIFLFFRWVILFRDTIHFWNHPFLFFHFNTKISQVLSRQTNREFGKIIEGEYVPLYIQ